MVGELHHPPTRSCIFCLGADICKTSHETTGWEQDSTARSSSFRFRFGSEIYFAYEHSPHRAAEPLSFCLSLGWNGAPLCGVTGKCSWETFFSAHISGARDKASTRSTGGDWSWDLGGPSRLSLGNYPILWFAFKLSIGGCQFTKGPDKNTG